MYIVVSKEVVESRCLLLFVRCHYSNLLATELARHVHNYGGVFDIPLNRVRLGDRQIWILTWSDDVTTRATPTRCPHNPAG